MVNAAGMSPQRGNKRAKRTSPAAIGAAWIVTTVVAAIAGGVFGLQIATFAEHPKDDQNEAPAERSITPAPAYSASGTIRALPPVVTKLSGPQSAWVRIEASIVLADNAAEEEEVLAAKTAEDMMAFLQTVSASDIEGPSGFLQLREDLTERARVRSGGQVRDLVLHTFILE